MNNRNYATNRKQDFINLPKHQRIQLPRNEPTLKQRVEQFKNYVNKHHKLIGYEIKNNKNVYNSTNDDLVIFKFLCDKDCKCEDLFNNFKHFTIRHEIFMEHGIYSLNGHLLYHQFKLYIK